MPTLICDFCMQNSDFWSRITSLYGSQAWPVVLCIQNGVISIRITSLYWFLDAKQWLLDRNNKSLGVPDITCRCVHENSVIRTRISSLYMSQTSSVVLSTHNCVLNTKIKRLYWLQPSPVVLCIQNSDLMTAIACVYGSQTSPVIFCMQNSVPSIRITSVCGS